MDPLRVAIPWNMSSYTAAKGFRPLYRPLFERNTSLDFNAIDDVALAHRLQSDRGFYRALLKRRSQRTSELPKFLQQSALGRSFVEYLSSDDVLLSSELPGAVELHHTSPLTTGNRPFVLHCESFLPIFQPFWSQGGRLSRVAEVRDLYSSLFKASTCLGIVSHIPSTLEQISRFFRDSAIDAKLHESRVGLSEASLNILSTSRRPKQATSPAFLFVDSVNQSSRSFALRGGFAALIFAERFLQSGREGQFLFRAGRPTDQELRSAGMDVSFLTSIEGTKLFWLQGYFPEHEQLRLFTIADFCLLPSVNLHSVTIMHALAGGAIPVVSDTYGTEKFVADGQTGIVLRGMREASWRDDPDAGIPVNDRHPPASLNGQLASQALQRITQLLAIPGATEDLRHAMRSAVKDNYIGQPFRDGLSTAVLRLWAEAPAVLRKLVEVAQTTLLASERLLRTSHWERLFESPPRPLVLANMGGARVLYCKGIYILVRDDLSLTLKELSPLVLREEGYLVPWKVEFSDRVEDFTNALFWPKSQGNLLVAKWRYAKFRLYQKAKLTLWSHKRLYGLAKWLYRTVASARRRLLRLSV